MTKPANTQEILSFVEALDRNTKHTSSIEELLQRTRNDQWNESFDSFPFHFSEGERTVRPYVNRVSDKDYSLIERQVAALARQIVEDQEVKYQINLTIPVIESIAQIHDHPTISMMALLLKCTSRDNFWQFKDLPSEWYVNRTKCIGEDDEYQRIAGQTCTKLSPKAKRIYDKANAYLNNYAWDYLSRQDDDPIRDTLFYFYNSPHMRLEHLARRHGFIHPYLISKLTDQQKDSYVDICARADEKIKSSKETQESWEKESMQALIDAHRDGINQLLTFDLNNPTATPETVDLGTILRCLLYTVLAKVDGSYTPEAHETMAAISEPADADKVLRCIINVLLSRTTDTELHRCFDTGDEYIASNNEPKEAIVSMIEKSYQILSAPCAPQVGIDVSDDAKERIRQWQSGETAHLSVTDLEPFLIQMIDEAYPRQVNADSTFGLDIVDEAERGHHLIP